MSVGGRRSSSKSGGDDSRRRQCQFGRWMPSFVERLKVVAVAILNSGKWRQFTTGNEERRHLVSAERVFSQGWQGEVEVDVHPENWCPFGEVDARLERLTLLESWRSFRNVDARPERLTLIRRGLWNFAILGCPNMENYAISWWCRCHGSSGGILEGHGVHEFLSFALESQFVDVRMCCQ